MLVSRCWTVGVALLAFVPAAAVAQAPDGTAPGGWIDPSWTQLRVSVDRAKEEEPPRSAGHTILLHTAVGTGTGLLVGLVFAGSTLTDDNTEVLLIWTAAGAAAGAISGLVTWLVTRDKSD